MLLAPVISNAVDTGCCSGTGNSAACAAHGQPRERDRVSGVSQRERAIIKIDVAMVISGIAGY